MPPVRSEVVIPSALESSAREAFTDALYAVHSRIFDGVDRDAFAHYVVDSPADETKILLHRDEAGEIVGYFAVHQFRRTVRGRPAVILRGETGVLREQRGGASTLRFGFGEAIRIVAGSPGVPVYYLGCLVHPTSYHSLCKYMRPVWPSVETPPDAELRALLAELGDSFGLARVAEDPLVREVGWRTRDTEAERAFWRRCDKPDVRFYIESNPGYGEGHGLLTLAPVSPIALAGALSRIAREKGDQRLAGLRARAHHLPLASRWLLPREVRRRLQHVSLFEGLDDARLDVLAARAEVVSHPAGRSLMTEGQQGDELYVIDSGAVHVTASRGGEDVLLDQLDPGDVLGEIGALTGEPRTASARTATRATLVRIGRRALLDAMAADPGLADAIWARYAERRFEYAAETHPTLARMSRTSRFAFLRQGTPFTLEPGGSRASAGPGLVYVVRGELVIEQGGTRIVGRAPLLLEIGDALRLEARAPTHAIELPAPPASVLFQTFHTHPLLARLPAHALAALLAAARPVPLDPDEPLFAAGDRADAFYLVERGAIDIVLGGEPIARLAAGDCFGERGLDPAGPGVRTAGARTVGPTALLRVPGDVFRRLAGPVVFGAVEPAAERPRDELTAMLGAAWLDAPPAQIEAHYFPAGAVILREGDPADAAWYLVEGLARVEQAGAVISQVRPGECFGERAVLMDVPRTASVVAETDVVANRLDARAFARWCREQPRLGDLLASLSQLYAAPDGARTSAVYRGTHEGHPCTTAVTRLADGCTFAATKLVDRPVLLLSCDDGRGLATDHIDHERAAPGARRRIGHRGERLVSILLEGELDAAAAAGERLRNGRRLTRGELERFRWTGRLGAPATGGERLVCGCLGLTRSDLEREQAAGCTSIAALTARTGAGGVCGGCVPLMQRLLGTAQQTASAHPDEVDLDAFEARLDGLRHIDGTKSLSTPDTVVWHVYGETVALLGAARALLLQFANPVAAQALVEHSALVGSDASNRLHRTLEYMYGMVFGEGTTMLRLAREVHGKHSRVSGSTRAGLGPFRPGERYSANQIELLLWVAATVLDTAVLTHEAFIAPLSLADKDRIVAEAADLFGLFGIPVQRFPGDWAAFRSYFDGALASGVLVVGDDARTLARGVLEAPRRESEPVFWVLRRLTARWLPEPMRAPFGLDDGPVARATAAGLERAIRAGVPRLPRELRYCPARLDAERRLAGQPGRDPGAVRLERVIAAIFGVEVPARAS
jgi:CRP-like cAMP-binding protein/uncharacterized protein (DUF2236 family)/bacterioferritin-associated ferredoxin